VQDIIDRLNHFISKELLQSDQKLTADSQLIESGILTSLQTIELVGFISAEFGVEIEPEEINEEEFRSLSTIAALVQRKKA
jgi:acyl carrier protein